MEKKGESARNVKRKIHKEKDIFANSINFENTTVCGAPVVNYKYEEELICDSPDHLEENQEKRNIKDKLGEWYFRNRLSQKCFDELLVILNEENIDVPLSAYYFEEDEQFGSGENSFPEDYNHIELEKQFQKLETIIKDQNKIIMDTLATHTVLLKNQADLPDDLTCNFPLKSVEEIKEMDSQISDANRTHYIKTLRTLLKGKLTKKLDSVLTTNVIIDTNIDGTHGKQSLKALNNFFQVLLDAIDGADPLKELRLSIGVIKKRYFHKNCVQKAKEKMKY